MSDPRPVYLRRRLELDEVDTHRHWDCASYARCLSSASTTRAGFRLVESWSCRGCPRGPYADREVSPSDVADVSAEPIGSLKRRVIEFLYQNEGRHSLSQIADAVRGDYDSTRATASYLAMTGVISRVGAGLYRGRR